MGVLRRFFPGFNFDWVVGNDGTLLDFAQFKIYSERRSKNYLRISKFPTGIIEGIFNRVELDAGRYFRENRNSNKKYALIGSGHLHHLDKNKICFYDDAINEKHLDKIFSDRKITEGNYFGSPSFIINFSNE